MRRSKFRKVCFMLFLVLAIFGGYYAYQTRIKKLYEKYSRLMQQENEREKLALQKIESQRKKQEQQPVQQEDGVQRKFVNGVEFVIDQHHEDPSDVDNNPKPEMPQPPVQDAQEQDTQVDHKEPPKQPTVVKDDDVDDNGKDIPDDADLPLDPHEHHGHQHWHEVKRLGVDGDRKIEREVINGVEFIVNHNGEDVPEKKSPIDSLVKQVEKDEGPLKDIGGAGPANDESLAKIHGLMNEYRKRIQVDQPGGVIKEPVNAQIARPVNQIQQDEKQVAQAPPQVQQDEKRVAQAPPQVQQDEKRVSQAPLQVQQAELNDAGAKIAQKESLMQRLGIQEPLDDSKIMKIIVSGKVSEDDAKALMQYHSNNLAAKADDAEANPDTGNSGGEPQKKPKKDAPLNSLKVYDLSEEADLTFDCVKLKLLNNDTKICVNDPKIDKPISASLVEKGTWESQNLQEFQRALVACPQCGVLDLGSNLGVYSLTAAHYGRQVLAVEPLLENIRPFHKSVQINDFNEQIVLLRNAVSDRHGYMEVKYPVPPNNLGAVYAEHVDYKMAMKDNIGTNIVRAITLEDLKFVVDFKSVILKIDLQGMEHSVFKNSMGFFDQRDVPYIFMHWQYDEYKQATLETADFLVRKGYQPKITINGNSVGVSALTRDQHLLIWVKQYAQPEQQE
ncbi:hypothetical protein LOTGIDRAFT_228109 [Lottia gigantea]|uniref:Methyltransferase FkbM domain-containing protein n=1 Tax=Lottia gigantea TaxID=225164 RepID=V4BCW8_LOTGI|nr:hypothetical protein LOTGIDRAFT_228109 [Lottia gigantea]ESP05591.1 hypothetical protein LOTGIDRAFT_228109 [Lottia gigantea]